MTSGPMEGDVSRTGGAAGLRSGEGLNPAVRNPHRAPQQRPEPVDWREWALCREVDPERWFPEQGGSTKEAKRICGDCPVKAECLAYALANDMKFGIWGGQSELDRKRLREPKPRREPVQVVQRPTTEKQLEARRANIRVAHAKRAARKAS